MPEGNPYLLDVYAKSITKNVMNVVGKNISPINDKLALLLGSELKDAKTEAELQSIVDAIVQDAISEFAIGPQPLPPGNVTQPTQTFDNPYMGPTD